MQIHELTQKPSDLNEGLWDSIKATLSSDPNLAGMTLDQKEAYIKQGNLVKTAADKAALAWAQYAVQLEKSITDPKQLDQFKKRQSKVYENALRSFVVRNLFVGLPYENLNNRGQAEALIKAMSQPGAASPSAQAPLWQQLAQVASVSQVEAQAPPPSEQSKAINVQKAAQSIQNRLSGATKTDTRNIGQFLATNRSDAWQVLSKSEKSKVVNEIAKALTNKGISVQGYSPASSPVAAASALASLAAATPAIKSTGNTSLDSVLVSLGFNLI
jgi:NADH dehydrogenase/NADH:ubiquinone oxidoreductase subunit G